MDALSPRAHSRVLSAAVSALLAGAAGLAHAQSEGDILESVTVTATRRAESIQDVPFNIAAVSGEAIREQGVTSLVDISRTVPGLFVIDQGARAPNSIVVRGLNATSISGTEALGNSGGGKVATYVGEIPFYIDLKPEDLERVEVLLGPQGTLYGAGTLGGAIRYIPRRPQFDAPTVQLRADTYTLAHSDGYGGKAGFTLNLPLSERFAFRASLDYLDDPGFIDNNYLVRQAGVSDPQPDFSDPAAVAANLFRRKDIDDQQTLSGRAALRWAVSDTVDVNLTYYHQDQEVGGRTMNHREAFGTGRYESAARFLEPNDRENRLAALEVTAQLGFAELTSATGYAEFEESGQRDQTDLLLYLNVDVYTYDDFPTFSAFTLDEQEDERFNQEFRLVSTHDGPLSWIAGAFYNKYEFRSTSAEYTPEFSEYIGGDVRPDDLEYYAVLDYELVETAAYGELSYDITDRWQVTVGGRYYDYDLDTRTAVDFPLINTAFLGRGPDEIVLDFVPAGQADSGTLFKFNTSYHFSDDMMGYFTVSEGYRIGNNNGLELCDADPNTQQTTCATPREFEYFPDSTTNYEIGIRSQWWGRRLTLNAALYHIDWEDIQLTSASLTGASPITLNGGGARSQGLELSIGARLTDGLEVSATYGYVSAELTEDAPDLIRTITPPGFDGGYADGFDGDRLPGSPEHQGSLSVAYTFPVGANEITFNYGVSAVSDILTRVGGRGGGEALPGFALHSASAVYRADQWSVMLYARNLLDKYAETGVRTTREYVQSIPNETGELVAVRAYSKDIVRPREVGLRLTYEFGW